MAIAVTLGWSEVNQGAEAGVHRRIRAMWHGRIHKGTGPAGSRWVSDIEGALGEMAVAKALGIYWSDQARLDKDGGDVGPYQVRSTIHQKGCLMIWEDDRDDDRVILVTHDVPRFILQGWIRAKDGKQPDFWRPDLKSPCYFVPQERLCDMADIAAPDEGEDEVIEFPGPDAPE